MGLCAVVSIVCMDFLLYRLYALLLAWAVVYMGYELYRLFSVWNYCLYSVESMLYGLYGLRVVWAIGCTRMGS
jgi:hypothetical protein